MIRSPRQKRPPKKFTPTQSTIYSQENYLLRFEDNGELIVIKRSSIRSIIEDKAVVGTGEKRRFAIIEAKGTYSQCNNMYEQMKLHDPNITTDQEDILDQLNESEDDNIMNDDSDENEITTQSSLTGKRKLSSLIVDDNDEDFDGNPILSQHGLSTNKKCRRFADNLSTTQNHVLTNKNNKETGTVEAREVYKTIDDMHHMVLQKLEKKFYSFTKKLDQLIPHAAYQNLDSYREKEEAFPSKVMHGDKDLLTTRGRDIYDFARQTLKILFTSTELSSCILPPARSYLTRPALDTERFNTFHEAVRVKYRISILHYDNCYSKLIRPRMSDFLIDERKRQAKALKQQLANNGEQIML